MTISQWWVFFALLSLWKFVQGLSNSILFNKYETYFFNVKYIGKKHGKAKQFHLKVSFCFAILGQTNNEVKNMYHGYIHCFRNHMIRFSTKPGNQTDETESSNLVNKTGLAKKWQSNKPFLYFDKTFPWLTQLKLRRKSAFFYFSFSFFLFFVYSFLFRIFLLGFIIP